MSDDLLDRIGIDDLSMAKGLFRENGYVIIRDFFKKEEIDDFNQELASIIRAYARKAGLGVEGGIFDDVILALEEFDHEYVAGIYDTIFQSPSFMRIAGKIETVKWVQNLLSLDGDAALYGYTNRCRIDPPRDNRRTYGWHQEVFYTVPEGHYIQTWAPLVFDTNVQNGTIEIAAGSHKEGIAPQSWIEEPGRATQIIVNEDVIKKYKCCAVDMRVGEMLFFSGKLAHRSGQNTSNSVRYSLVGMYHDVGHIPFVAPKIGFGYRGPSPREYYEKIFM